MMLELSYSIRFYSSLSLANLLMQDLQTTFSPNVVRFSSELQKMQDSTCFLRMILSPWTKISTQSLLLMSNVSRISMGITILPRASTGLNMPVDFIIAVTPFIVFASAIRGTSHKCGFLRRL